MCASHPHAFAWYCLTARFSDVVRQSWTAAAAPAAKKEGKKDAGNKKGGDKPAKKKRRLLSKMNAMIFSVLMTKKLMPLKLLTSSSTRQLLPRLRLLKRPVARSSLPSLSSSGM